MSSPLFPGPSLIVAAGAALLGLRLHAAPPPSVPPPPADATPVSEKPQPSSAEPPPSRAPASSAPASEPHAPGAAPTDSSAPANRRAPASGRSPEPEPDPTLETVLVLNDGGQVTGQLVAVEENVYVMRINGIPTRFSRDSVRRVQAQVPVAERYRQLRAAIDDNDAENRLRLADWLRSRRQYDLALAEVEGVLKVAPGNREAKDLKVLLEQQLILERESQRRREAKGDGTADPARAVAPPARPAKPEIPMLNPEQINLIRVYELDLRDLPAVSVPRELVTLLINDYKSSDLIPQTDEGRKELYQRSPAQIIDLMFRLQARKYYGMVDVRTDPPALERFRDDVHRSWVINSCATARCHGGTDAGRLWLATSRPYSDETVYTNFMILDRFRLRDASGKEVPLIDYTEPAKSPLLQLALPRNLSTFPHPVVRSDAGHDLFRPPIRNPNERRFRATADWIRGMYQPRPDYTIDYQPPVPPPLQNIPPAAPAPVR